MQARIKTIKNELQELQNSDNSRKIEQYSKLVTELYESGKNDSEIIKTDFGRDGFRIAYLKEVIYYSLLKKVLIKIEK